MFLTTYYGHYEDIGTDLYYNRFRYYDPEAGVYISQDPIGLSGGFEPYLYARNPEVTSDPFGLFNKPISWPSFNKINVDIDHIVSNHTVDGEGYKQSIKAGGKKDLFPAEWNKEQIEKRVREAYKNTDERMKVRRQVSKEDVYKIETKHVIRGNSGGYRIEMWYNADTKTIETAYAKGIAKCP